jgi:hypothetical protein
MATPSTHEGPLVLRTQYPFNGCDARGVNMINPDSDGFYCFIPMEHFIPSPVTFEQFNKDAALALNSERMLSIFGGSMHMMGLCEDRGINTGSDYKHCVTSITLVPKASGGESPAGMVLFGSVALPPRIQKRKKKKDKKKKKKKGGEDEKKEESSDEEEEKETKAEKAKRIQTEQESCPAGVIADMIRLKTIAKSMEASNRPAPKGSGEARSKHGAAKQKRQTFFQTMTGDEYRQEVIRYCPIHVDATSAYKINHSHSPFNPVNVFSLTIASTLMLRYGVDERFALPDQWIRKEKKFGYSRFTFPAEGKTTWRINAIDMDPQIFYRYVMPHRSPPTVLPSDTSFKDMKLRYARSSYEKALDSDDAGDEKEKKEQGEAEDEYAHSRAYEEVATCRATFAGYNLRGFRARSLAIMAAAREAKPDPSEIKPDMTTTEKETLLFKVQSDAMEEARSICIEDFLTSWNEYGQLSIAQTATMLHMRETLKTDGTFCMPFDYKYKNITPFGHQMAIRTLYHEFHAHHYITHAQAILMEIAVLTVARQIAMHLHVILLGLTASGKSHCLKGLIAKCILQTIESRTAQSDKSFFTNGDNIDWMTLAFEEVPPGILGFGNNMVNGKGASGKDSAQNDFSTFIRSFLTSGDINYTRTVKDDNGSFTTEKILKNLQVCIVGASNIKWYDMTDNMRDRTCVTSVPKSERPDMAFLDMQMKTLSQKIRVQKDQYIKRFRRDFALSCFCYEMQRATVMEEVEMTNVMSFLGNVFAAGEKRGISTRDNSRNIDRVKIVVECLTKTDSFWKYLDGPKRVMNEKEPWCFKKFVRIQETWIARIEHAVFALTLMQHSFEDPLLVDFVRAVNAEIRNGEPLSPTLEWKEDKDGQQQEIIIGADEGVNYYDGEMWNRPMAFLTKDNNTATYSWNPYAQLNPRSRKGMDGVRRGRGPNKTESAIDTYEHVIEKDSLYTRSQQFIAMISRSHHLRQYQKEDLAHAIKVISEQESVTHDKHGKRVLIPAIQWLHMQTPYKTWCVKFSNAFWGSDLKQEVQSSFLESVKDALRSQGIPNIEYVTGICETDRPYILKTWPLTTIKHGYTDLPPFVIRNTSFVNEELSSMMDDMLGVPDEATLEEKVREEKKGKSGKVKKGDSLIEKQLRTVDSIQIYDGEDMYALARESLLVNARVTYEKLQEQATPSGLTYHDISVSYLSDDRMTPGTVGVDQLYPQSIIALVSAGSIDGKVDSALRQGRLLTVELQSDLMLSRTRSLRGVPEAVLAKEKNRTMAARKKAQALKRILAGSTQRSIQPPSLSLSSSPASSSSSLSQDSIPSSSSSSSSSSSVSSSSSTETKESKTSTTVEDTSRRLSRSVSDSKARMDQKYGIRGHDDDGEDDGPDLQQQIIQLQWQQHHAELDNAIASSLSTAFSASTSSSSSSSSSISSSSLQSLLGNTPTLSRSVSDPIIITQPPHVPYSAINTKKRYTTPSVSSTPNTTTTNKDDDMIILPPKRQKAIHLVPSIRQSS